MCGNLPVRDRAIVGRTTAWKDSGPYADVIGGGTNSFSLVASAEELAPSGYAVASVNYRSTTERTLYHVKDKHLRITSAYCCLMDNNTAEVFQDFTMM